jgi:MFS transporter, DHA1 family, inner membrane transport protein
MSHFSVPVMTTTASHLPVPDSGGTGDQRVPWPVLIALGGATMIMVTGEMLPTAVLPQMSAGLHVTEARIGLLVSLWAAVVVAVSFPLVGLTRRFDRRSVIVLAMLVFGFSAAATALAPSYHGVLAARTLGAAAVGLLWSTVNAYVADLVPDRLLGRATAVVLGGATLGMVLGTPLGRFVADLTGWQAAFWLLAGASAVMAWLIRTVAPVRAATRGSDSHLKPAAARPLAPMLTVTLLVAVVLVGHYGAYTYITRLAELPASAIPGGMGSLLLAFGLASAVGVAIAGRIGNRPVAALVASVTATAVTLAGLAAATQGAVLGLLVVLAWGIASGALPPLAQTQILRLAGEEYRWLAGALIPVLFNGGIAVGAALASMVVASHGVSALPAPAATLVALAAAGLAALARPRTSTSLR